MKKIFLIILILPLCSFAQIYNYNRVFNDSLVFKNFNQGFIDSQEYFIATNDYLFGVISTPLYFVPVVISFLVPPKNKRLGNIHNPNNKYLDINNDYYNGYVFGATKKKRKRLIEGTITPLLVVGTLLISSLSSSN